jgi:hypothetical protein
MRTPREIAERYCGRGALVVGVNLVEERQLAQLATWP